MRTILSILSTLIVGAACAQSINVQNMSNYLRNKEYDKAKAAADAAMVHESTAKSPKMWMYRGNVYQAIYSDTSQKVKNIDMEAEEKALDAYINCLKNDKENVYKDDVKGPLVKAAAATNNKAAWYRQGKEYEKALKCYDLLEQSIPFDFDGGIKRNNITKEKLMYSKFEMFKSIPDKAKTTEYANKLIDMKYKEPKLFTDMIRISLLDKDTAAALQYIEKGKKMFEDNMDIINYELDIYKARKKTDELKSRLLAAIELSPNNEILHFSLANLYNATGKPLDAEKEFLKALEVKADYEPAIYNLGVIYYNQAKEWNDKLNNAAPRDPKIKEYEGKVSENFKKAAEYFEKSFDITKDARTRQLLRQIFLRLGDTEKANQYKQ